MRLPTLFHVYDRIRKHIVNCESDSEVRILNLNTKTTWHNVATRIRIDIRFAATEQTKFFRAIRVYEIELEIIHSREYQSVSMISANEKFHNILGQFPVPNYVNGVSISIFRWLGNNLKILFLLTHIDFLTKTN